MKKLLLTLLIILSSLVSFSQESALGLAYQFYFGRVINDEIQWVDEPTLINIYVQFNDHEVIIYSEGHQVYQIEKEIGREGGTVMWSAMDKKSNNCWLFLTEINQTELALTIRYNDYAWMYICTEAK